ncbi:transforming acidic coiled-coil-containing protein 3-like isoform X2 [Liolophura sinensis]|uniref:transforming acidic coiled-coil-containing protein 3-like isoform X2 n=1 Tax=Liolophura sinensis TaxID=3198878 RepID=UPI0031582BDB
MADNGNNEDDALPPLPRGSYNINFDELDENTNPFQTSSKVAMSPMPARKNQPTTGADGDNPFQSKSKIGRSPPGSPAPDSFLTPPPEEAGGDFDDNIDPFATKNALQNSPPLPRKTAYEIVENTVEDSSETSPPRPQDDDTVALCELPSQPAQPKMRKTPSGQKAKAKKKRLSKEIKNEVAPASVPDIESQTDPIASPSDLSTLANSACSSANLQATSPQSAESPNNNNNKKGTQNLEGNSTQPVAVQEPESKPQDAPNPSKKKQARIKKPVKPLKSNKAAEEEIEIFAPPSKPKASQDTAADLPAESPNPTSGTGEPTNQGTQSDLFEQEGPSQDWSQTDDGMGESVQDDFPGDFPADERTGGSPEGEFVDCKTSVHEFGTGDDQGLGDMGDEPNEEFVPASDVFTDPDAWEMLEKLGGEGNFKDTDLARQSLYVKFDPLNQVEDQMRGKSKEKVIEAPALDGQGDDLLQMNTPPVKKGTPKAGKHPAVKRLEQHVAGTEEVGGAREVDQIYSRTPNAGEKADSGHAGSACTASPPKSGPGGEDDLVDMLKYTQHDMNKLRRDLELEFQGRLLSKEKEWCKKVGDREKEASNLRDQVEKIKAAHENMKSIVSDYEKTISQLVADKEKSSSESKDSLGEIIKDRDQAVEDLRSVESAFSDLHRRYEKIKTVVDGFKKNEEILKKSIQDYQGKLKGAEQRFQALKNQAEEKLDLANQEIEKVRKNSSSEVARARSCCQEEGPAGEKFGENPGD